MFAVKKLTKVPMSTDTAKSTKSATTPVVGKPATTPPTRVASPSVRQRVKNALPTHKALGSRLQAPSRSIATRTAHGRTAAAPAFPGLLKGKAPARAQSPASALRRPLPSRTSVPVGAPRPSAKNPATAPKVTVNALGIPQIPGMPEIPGLPKLPEQIQGKAPSRMTAIEAIAQAKSGKAPGGRPAPQRATAPRVAPRSSTKAPVGIPKVTVNALGIPQIPGMPEIPGLPKLPEQIQGKAPSRPSAIQALAQTKAGRTPGRSAVPARATAPKAPNPAANQKVTVNALGIPQIPGMPEIPGLPKVPDQLRGKAPNEKRPAGAPRNKKLAPTAKVHPAQAPKAPINTNAAKAASSNAIRKVA